MVKKDLIKALEGLDDDALIYVKTEYGFYRFNGYEEKVTGDDVQNEITLIAD